MKPIVKTFPQQGDRCQTAPEHLPADVVPQTKTGGPIRSASGVAAAALEIGPLRLDGRAILAPMAGVTDAGMRRIACEFGASLAVSEMVAAGGLSRGDRESRLRAEGQGIGLHAVQIAGCRPDDMADAARMAEASGAALIDINMGCPAKRVTGGLAGSALMRDLDAAVVLIRATVGAVTVPVTVKMRLGWDETSINAPELARRAEAEGVSLLTIHGRTRCQFYGGRADWQAVRAVVDAVSIPVVVNGDCHVAGDAATALAQSGAAAVMIGRAAVGQPWLVGQIATALQTGIEPAAPSMDRRLQAALAHYRSLLSSFGIARGLRHARKHLAAYAATAKNTTPVASQWRTELVQTDDHHAAERLLTLLFSTTDAGGELDACAA